jgi:DNA-binding NtrC family response regulator
MPSSPDRILIVDDETNLLTALELALSDEAYSVVCASSATAGLHHLEKESFDLLITDLRLPDMDGLELLRTVQTLDPTLIVIVLTAYGTIDSAVTALQNGAYHYLTKPLDIQELKAVITNALRLHCLTKEVESLRRREERERGFPPIVGQSALMQTLLRQVHIVARSESTVLIQGESGTGKELIARAIHEHSLRREGPFLVVDCGAVPEPLLESELFGYTKGAFTGANAPKKGLFAEANRGTLLLDEIGNTSLALQVKLLRVLQESEIRLVGSTQTTKVDVRVLAATNKNLQTEVKEQRFREDLYYRLAVIPLFVPPLRERHEDIPLLVAHFIHKYCERNKVALKTIAPPALQLLVGASWPGNVRELEHVIERAILFTPGPVIQAISLFLLTVPPTDDTPLALRQAAASVTSVLAETEKDTIQRALRRVEYNRVRAAKVLGISRSTLYLKLKRYHLMH